MVLGYAVSASGVDQYYFTFYSFNSFSNVSWSLSYRLAQLPSSPEGIENVNGTIESYDDTISESLLTIAYVGTRYVLAWEYNGTVLYRTWSRSSNDSQIYSVSLFN